MISLCQQFHICKFVIYTKMIKTQTLIFFIIGTVPIVFAAVQPWVWSFYSVLMVIVFLLMLWLDRVRFPLAKTLIYSSTVILFLIVTLVHSIPLSDDIVSYLSSGRMQNFSKAQILLDSSDSLLTLSYSPLISISWWIFLLSLSLFFISVSSLCVDSKKLKRVVYVIMGLAIIEGLYGLIQTLVPNLGVLWADHVQAYMGDARGTFINRNHFACFLGMVWPLALGFMMAQGGWGQGYSLKKILNSERLDRQALLALGIVVILLALLFSRSRAGIAGASTGLLTFIILTRNGNKGRFRYNWLFLVGISVILAAFSITIGVETIADRFLRIGDGDSRLDFWRDSLPIIKDHPLGIGLRNFEKVFPVYNVSNLSNKIVDHTHNDYLQLLIETGWIGFLTIMAGFIIFMIKSAFLIKRLDSKRDPMRFFLAVGAFSGLTSLAFHSFFDFNLQIPANCVYFVTLIAILYSCAWQSADNTDRFRGSHRVNTKDLKTLATDPHRKTQTFRSGVRGQKNAIASKNRKFKNENDQIHLTVGRGSISFR